MLVEKLLDSDKKMMESYIDSYAMSDIATRTASLDYILRVWDEAKSEYLYRMMGNQFTVSKEVEIFKDENQLFDEIDNKLLAWNSPHRRFCDGIRNIGNRFQIYHTYWDDEYTEEELASRKTAAGIYNLLSCENLASNSFKDETFELPLPNGKSLRVSQGCKVSKMLGKIAKEFNIDGFEEFRLDHSMCLNEKTLHGHLVLSIHPFDYMTMSDNDSNWCSCMSWTDCGEYRRGTVEMMNSPMVVCAYLTADHDYNPCYGITWNSKKWRELFIVTPATIAGIKGYPYWNRDLENKVIMILRQMAQENLNWGPYTSEPVTFRPGEYCNVRELNTNYVFRFCTDAMYCDFYDKHQAIVSYNAPLSMEINYSGASECMGCGSIDHYFESEGDLVCEGCDESCRCADCGYRYNRSELIEVDGEYLCDYCYNELPSCDCCGEHHFDSNMNQIYLANDEGLLRGHSLYLCDDCWNDNEYFDSSEVHYAYYRWSRYDYVKVEDCTDKMLTMLGFDNVAEVQDCTEYLIPYDEMSNCR